MLTHLIASQGYRRRLWDFRTLTLSGVLHAFMVAGLAFATVESARQEDKLEEQISFLEIKEPEVKPEPKTPEPPPEAKPAVTPPPPKGFQELVPPKEPPPVIPDVDLSQPAVRAEDFSGLGTAGGVAGGVEGGTPQNAAEKPVEDASFAYEVAVLDRPPELSNRAQVQSTLARLYPRMLQDAGIEGTVMLQFVITPEGSVDAPTVKVISTTHELFADASVKAVERFRFRPGRYKGQPVRVLIQMPITWKPQT